MVIEIILGISLLIAIYVIINLLFKLEKLETWIQNIEEEITQVQTDIIEIDDRGYFESDDEVGTKFSQIT